MSGAPRAYAVLETAEDTGGIVFARHAVVARRQGADEFAGGDFSGVTCRRMPGLDRYAEEGVVPASVLIECGWHFECWCGERINEDRLAERDLSTAGVIGSDRSVVYCSAACLARHEQEKIERVAFEAEVLDRLKAYVLRRLPDAEFDDREAWQGRVHARCIDGVWMWDWAILSVVFPEMAVAPATCRFEFHPICRSPSGCIVPRWECSVGDLAAFEVFVAEQRLKRAVP